MKTLKDLLNSDFNTVAEWLEENADNYYLVPKDFIPTELKESIVEQVETNVGLEIRDMFDDYELHEAVGGIYSILNKEMYS